MTHPRLTFLFAAAAALVLSACATSTPYQPADSSGRGYTDQQLESNRWRVSFKGNTLTSREQVENYLLYRAAEITTQRGFDYFIIVEGAVDQESSFRTYSSGFYGSYGFPYTVWGLHARGHFGYPGYANDYYTRERVEFRATADVLMHKGEKPGDDARAYDAREIMRNLAGTIQLPQR